MNPVAFLIEPKGKQMLKESFTELGHVHIKPLVKSRPGERELCEPDVLSLKMGDRSGRGREGAKDKSPDKEDEVEFGLPAKNTQLASSGEDEL
jgi:hypothetical protein